MQTIIEVAATLKVSERRVRKLCEQGRIAGARRVILDGGLPLWEIPNNIAIRPGKRGPKLRIYGGPNA